MIRRQAHPSVRAGSKPASDRSVRHTEKVSPVSAPSASRLPMAKAPLGTGVVRANIAPSSGRARPINNAVGGARGLGEATDLMLTTPIPVLKLGLGLNVNIDLKPYFSGARSDTAGTWTLVGAPLNLVIDSTTGVITGIMNQVGHGAMRVDVIAAKPGGAGRSVIISWEAGAVPEATPPIPAQLNDTNDAINLDISVHFAHVDSYLAESLPPGVLFSTTTGVFSGTPTTPGTYSTNVIGFNPYGYASATFSWVITAA